MFLISKWVEMTATVGLAYLTGNYQQQGMDNVSNPILAGLFTCSVVKSL